MRFVRTRWCRDRSRSAQRCYGRCPFGPLLGTLLFSFAPLAPPVALPLFGPLSMLTPLSVDEPLPLAPLLPLFQDGVLHAASESASILAKSTLCCIRFMIDSSLMCFATVGSRRCRATLE